MKPCSYCDRTLPDSSFRGKRRKCIDCEREYDRERYTKDTEKRKAAVTAWKAANPEAQRMYVQRRRALKMSQTAQAISPSDLVKRMSMYAGCWICGERIGDGELHYDHKKPLSKGGVHTLSNLAPAHALCNLVKGSSWWGIDRLDALLEHIVGRVEELQMQHDLRED